MALISLSIPNFVSGVSQQPPSLKLNTSVDSMDNCWPSVISGVSKRPPTEFLKNLGTAFTSTAIGNIINRTGVSQFVIIIADGNLRVIDFEGNEKTVNFPYGKQYLQQALDPASAFKFVNIQDTTFILNKEVTVQADAFGELNGSSYTPDGQVYAYANLPNPATTGLGLVYQLTSTGQYYKNTLQPATSATFSWNQVGSAVSSPTTGDPVVTSLPSSSTAGAKVWLKYSWVSYTPVWNGSYWVPVPVTNTNYTMYQSVQTAAATAAYNYWKLTAINEIVTALNNGRRNPANEGTVFITNSVANVYYNVYVNNVLKASYLSPKGVDAATSVPGTADIATNVKNLLVSSGYTVEQNGSTLTITNLAVTDTITGTSSGGDKLVKCWRNKVPTFSDLPPNSPQGRILQVAGDLEAAQDDFFVMFNEGRWEETYAYGAGLGLLANTMPWVLLRNDDDTFTFTKHTWRSRACGDNTSGKVPSFVGYRINDMFLFANRLGFITDSDIIMSETYRYENFFRTTLASLQDSDPLDLTVATQNDDTLRHVVPFNKELLIMADKSQYRFQYTQFVGPKNVQIAYTTAFNVSRDVAPSNMGNSVYFVDDRPTYRNTKVFEYYPKPNMQGDDADEVTEPIPNFIPSGIKFLAGSPRKEMLVMGVGTARLYVYKFFWAGEKKIQNAWHRWIFPDATVVYWAGFIDNFVYMLIKRGTNVHLERIRVDEETVQNATSTANRTMLDRLVSSTQGDVVVAGGSTTYLTLPYTFTTTPVVIAYNPSTGVTDVIDPTVVASNELSIVGNYSTWEITVGIPYESKFTLATPYVKKASSSGQVSVLDGRLSIRYLHLSYSNTSSFKVLIQRKGYPDKYVDKLTAFSGNLIDNVDLSTDSIPAVDGQMRVPILAHNLEATVSIINDSPFNFVLQSGEWWASWHPRTKQIG